MSRYCCQYLIVTAILFLLWTDETSSVAAFHSTARMPSSSFSPAVPIKSTPHDGRILVVRNPSRIIKMQNDSSSSVSSSSKKDNQVDTSALMKYVLAIGIQMSAITTCLYLLDVGIRATKYRVLPLPVVGALIFLASLRSRILSPLDNRRPNRKELLEKGSTRGYRDRILPSWTPPGFFFPIMWILIIAPLRAYSSTLLYQANGGYFVCSKDPTILWLMLHLSIGDTWNTINNVERRLGTAVSGIYLVLLSSLFASYKYYQVVPLAGKLLGLTCLWLATASVLVTQTWRLNPLPNGQKDKLYPVVGDIQTRFVFESAPK